MAKQQLYIDGVAVDMPQDGISIKVESNLFSDAGNIKTAHSYSITLPRTMTNDSIFANAYVPSADTAGNSTHGYLSCALWLDGIALFEDGRCVLASVEEDGYKCNLFWGLVDVFDKIKDEGLELCDLPLSSYWSGESAADWLQLQKDSSGGWSYNSGMDDTIYSTLNDESKSTVDKLPWWLPVVSASDILTRIQSVYGLTFSYSAWFSARLATLYHALTTRRCMCDGEQLQFSVLAMNKVIGSKNYLVWSPLPSAVNSSYWFDNAIDVQSYPINNQYDIRRKFVVKKLRVFGGVDKDFRVTSLFDSAGTIIPPKSGSTTPTYDGTRYVVDVIWEDAVVENFLLPDISLVGSGDDPYSSTAVVTDLRMDVLIEDIEDVERGEWWSLVRNYPKIKIIDYLSEILAHCGAFVVGSVTKPQNIRFVTFDEVAESAPQEPQMYQGLTTITMSLDDLARRNRYTHEDNDDDGLIYDASGTIYTNDATLERERDAFKSHFKVPREDMVLLFDVENDDSGTKKASWRTAGDYIGGKTLSPLTFCNTGQDFGATLQAYWSEYAGAVYEPKEINVTMRLSVMDLMRFDFEKPLYIAQLNRSYIVKSIESDSADTYKIKAIQI